MNLSILFFKVLLLSLFVFQQALFAAGCEIRTSSGGVAPSKNDILFLLLTAEPKCPTNVIDFKSVLKNDGLKVSASMVANRGIRNPALGSFSFFESATGRSTLLEKEIESTALYFGHFTALHSDGIGLDQSPAPGKLLIELIAWDFEEGVYNFYELIGTRGSAQWFYRGNSKDIVLDNERLHLQKNPARPEFGNRLRCSGCHTSGGPIMKELEFPHNDWWRSDRPLNFLPNSLNPDVDSLVNSLVDASAFSKMVVAGQDLLEGSKAFQDFKKTRSLREQLRPLFCTVEVNLVSSETVFSEEGANPVSVTANYWLNPLVLAGAKSISVPKKEYLNELSRRQMQFPETSEKDADHFWLAPVKSRSDNLAIQSLVSRGLIDDEFVADVLGVELNEPLFSKTRCQLLALLPESAAGDWQGSFLTSLKKSSLPAAKVLHLNLTDPKRNNAFFEENARLYLARVQEKMNAQKGFEEVFLRLINQRQQVFENEISKNPMGQILEPGFRVIFPVPGN